MLIEILQTYFSSFFKLNKNILLKQLFTTQKMTYSISLIVKLSTNCQFMKLSKKLRLRNYNILVPEL